MRQAAGSGRPSRRSPGAEGRLGGAGLRAALASGQRWPCTGPMARSFGRCFGQVFWFCCFFVLVFLILPWFRAPASAFPRAHHRGWPLGSERRRACWGRAVSSLEIGAPHVPAGTESSRSSAGWTRPRPPRVTGSVEMWSWLGTRSLESHPVRPRHERPRGGEAAPVGRLGPSVRRARPKQLLAGCSALRPSGLKSLQGFLRTLPLAPSRQRWLTALGAVPPRPWQSALCR